MGSNHRPEIDGLRAIAVLGVLLCHFRSPGIPGGYAGVDVFFVISGYLITRQIVRDLNRGAFSFAGFYVRRSRRIYPALVATLVLTMIAGAILFSPEPMRQLGVSIVAAALSVSNVLFWHQQGYFDASSNLKPLLHTWSLGIEEQFYLLWPLLLFFLARRARRIAVALLLLLIVSLGANLGFEGHTSTIFFLLPFRVFEFAIGGLITQLEKHAWRLSEGSAAGTVAGVLMIMFSYARFDDTTGFPSYPALLPCLGAALIIFCGLNRCSGMVLGNAVALYLGGRSYSLYLVHWPLAVFTTYIAERPWTWKTGLWLAVASLALAEVLYRFIEVPFRYPTRGALVPNRTLIPALVAATVVVIVGGTAASQRGWIWRLGDRAAAYENLVDGQEAAYGGNDCGNTCETKPGRPISAILIGDSNAQQYFGALKIAFPNVNFRIFQFSSCPFFSIQFTRDFEGFADPRLYDDGCRAARAAAFTEIRKTQATVIISQLWGNFPLISEKTGKKVRFRDFAEAAEFYADQAIDLQRELGMRTLIILGSLPGMSGNHQSSPVDCIFRPTLILQHCASSSVDVTRRSGNEKLAAALGERATFLNPFDALCDQRTCKLIDANVPIYSDANHFSLHGSQLVLDKFRSTIERAIR